jgi:hypothetical protein
MRLLVAMLTLAGCAGGSMTGPRPASPETTTIQGLRALTEPGDRAPGDSLAFVLDVQPVRGPDGEYVSPPGYGMDCDRRLDRWDGAAWVPVPNELWRPEVLVRQDHRPDEPMIVCRDALSTWRPGVSASRRFAYQLSGDAEPGWYRWCLTVSVLGVGGSRWLCSEVVLVGRSARQAG